MKHYKDKNNQIWAFELDGSQDHLIKSDMVAITDHEADVLRQKQMSEANEAYLKTLSYKELRAMEYPTIGDQLDALYHAGVFPQDMAAKIRTVKTKYPKKGD